MAETNVSGETPSEAFDTALVQTFAPALRDYLHGRGDRWTEERLRERLERELEGRGFIVV